MIAGEDYLAQLEGVLGAFEAWLDAGAVGPPPECPVLPPVDLAPELRASAGEVARRLGDVMARVDGTLAGLRQEREAVNGFLAAATVDGAPRFHDQPL